MNEQVTPCRHCANLPGCPILVDSKAEFQWNKVISEKNPGVCQHWAPMAEREAKTRDRLHGLLGDGYIKGLQLLPRPSLEDLRKEDDEMGYVPDFVGMIRDGMSAEERQDQLLYETDDEGNIVTEEGEKVPRGELPVRKYASDLNGPINQISPAECATIAFWDFEKIIAAVLKAEQKLGWIGGGKKGKKPVTKPAVKPKETAAAEPKKEAKKMAKSRVMIRRPGAKPAAKPEAAADKTPAKAKANAAAGGKVVKPATGKKTVARKKQGTKPEGEAQPAGEETQSVSGGGVDADTVKELVADAVKPLEEKLDAIIAAIGSGPNGRPLSDTIVDSATVLHDVVQQKINCLFLSMAVDEEGNPDPDVEFPTYVDEDGNVDPRVDAQNLLAAEDPENILSYYLDAEEQGEEEEGAE